MKFKNYFIAVLTSLLTVSVASIILVLIQYIFNIDMYAADFLLGFLGASAYFIAINKMKNNSTLNCDSEKITADMTKIHCNKCETLTSELNKCKDELEFMKTKYSNLKSETIVQKNIK